MGIILNIINIIKVLYLPKFFIQYFLKHYLIYLLYKILGII